MDRGTGCLRFSWQYHTILQTQSGTRSWQDAGVALKTPTNRQRFHALRGSSATPEH